MLTPDTWHLLTLAGLATHLRAINRHILQDVYSWAGEFRTVNIAKGGAAAFIEQALHDALRRLPGEHYLKLKGIDPGAFAQRAGVHEVITTLRRLPCPSLVDTAPGTKLLQ